MTLDELNQVDINNPEAVKQLQQLLRAQGYYKGSIDGKWGGGTTEGAKAFRDQLMEQARVSRDTKASEAATEQAKNSPLRLAQEAGPYLGGASAGILTGAAAGRANKKADADLAQSVARMPGNKKIGPVQAEAEMDRALGRRSFRSTPLAIGAGLGFGGAELTRRYIKPQVEPDAQHYVDLAANAEQGFGVGTGLMAAKNMVGDALGKSPIAPDVAAEVRTRAAEARGDPYTLSSKSAETAAAETVKADAARVGQLRAMSAAALKEEARAAGLPVGGLKEDLVQRLAKSGGQPAVTKASRIPRGRGGLLLPLAVGVGVYDALRTPSEAEPADASGVGDYLRSKVGAMSEPGPSPMRRYLDARVDPGDGAMTKLDDVYDDYVRYARETGKQPAPKQAFVRQLQAEGRGVHRVAGATRIEGTLRPAASRAEAAAAGAGAAGGAYATSRLMSKLPLRTVAPALGGAALMSMDTGLEGGSREETAQNIKTARGQASYFAPWIAEKVGIPREEGQAYDMAQVPERNPMAVAQARQSAARDNFENDLAAFYAAIDEHNASFGP